MSWIKYKYTCKMTSEGVRCNFPNVELELKNGDTSVKTQGLIDSGAEIIMVHKDFADVLGIDLSKSKILSIGGVNGTSESYISECFIEVKHHQDKIKTKVVFMDDLPVPVLLGQEGFFDSFKIKFEKAKGTFELLKEN